MTPMTQIISFLQEFAPLALAADWDNVGLILGDPARPVHRLMTCLTLTADVAEEAVQRQAELVVSHHPLLFRPTQKIVATQPEGALLLKLSAHGAAVYSPHTALDNAVGGINDGLARRLGLANVRPLRAQAGAARCKVAVFVPESDLNKVADAMFAAGAGVIGQYTQCSFRLAGTGTFFGSDASNPAVGQKGRREDVSEWRLEAVCPENKVDAVVRALRVAHSYEEPAYDVYTLRPEVARQGQGRLGELANPMTLGELAAVVRQQLPVTSLQIVGDPGRAVVKVALACGAAGEFVRDALQAQADVFLTGELRFHEALALRSAGLAALVPGHYATERPGVEDLAQRLRQEFSDLEIWASAVERDPLS